MQFRKVQTELLKTYICIGEGSCCDFIYVPKLSYAFHKQIFFLTKKCVIKLFSIKNFVLANICVWKTRAIRGDNVKSF